MDHEHVGAASNTRWGRIVIAAIMSELGVIVALLAATGIVALLTPMTDAQYASLGEEVGYYVAPTAGAITTLLSVLWATRVLTAGFIKHGLLIGAASVVLTVGFVFGARPDHQAMYFVAFALRIVGGYAGGIVSQWTFGRRGAAISGHSQ